MKDTSCQPEEVPEPPTAEEIAEYRRIRPALLRMVEEWQIVRGPGGCPVMAHLLNQ